MINMVNILVVPDVSVYDPGMSDSLISAGRLMEAGYNVKLQDSLMTSIMAMRLTFPIFFQMNETRDACSNVLSPFVATGKKR